MPITAQIYSDEFQNYDDWRHLREMMDEYYAFNEWLRYNYPTYTLQNKIDGTPANVFEVIKDIITKLGDQNGQGTER